MSKVVFISVYIFKFFIKGEHEKGRQFSEVVVMEYVRTQQNVKDHGNKKFLVIKCV